MLLQVLGGQKLLPLLGEDGKFEAHDTRNGARGAVVLMLLQIS